MRTPISPKRIETVWTCNRCDNEVVLLQYRRVKENNGTTGEESTFALACVCSDVPRGWTRNRALQGLPVKGRKP